MPLCRFFPVLIFAISKFDRKNFCKIPNVVFCWIVKCEPKRFQFETKHFSRDNFFRKWWIERCPERRTEATHSTGEHTVSQKQPQTPTLQTPNSTTIEVPSPRYKTENFVFGFRTPLGPTSLCGFGFVTKKNCSEVGTLELSLSIDQNMHDKKTERNWSKFRPQRIDIFLTQIKAFDGSQYLKLKSSQRFQGIRKESWRWETGTEEDMDELFTRQYRCIHRSYHSWT